MLAKVFLKYIFYSSLDSMTSSASIFFLTGLGKLFYFNPFLQRVQSLMWFCMCVRLFLHNLISPFNIFKK